eukprot:397268-Ditylum_brightwellii.AAC.1
MDGSNDDTKMGDDMEARENQKRIWIQQHPKLCLVEKHNSFMRNVFLKVKNRVNGMVMMELEKRKYENSQSNSS